MREALIAHPIDATWLQLHEHQRIVNSFLFNYFKIQDKIGAKLFRALLREWRELDDDALRLANIQLALDGYRHMRDIMHRIEHRLQAGAPDAHPPSSDPVVTPNRP